MEKDSKKYEIGFLAKNEGFKDELAKILTNFGAEISESGAMSRIKLAYPIKKEASAFFSYIYFSGQPEIVEKISDNLKLNSEILRHIIIVAPAIRQTIQTPVKRMRRSMVSERPVEKTEIRKPKPQAALSNEALEKKLEEILK